MQLGCCTPFPIDMPPAAQIVECVFDGLLAELLLLRHGSAAGKCRAGGLVHPLHEVTEDA